jgi:hypothetical protein
VANARTCDDPAALRASLAAGDYGTSEPRWRDLRIGTVTIPVGKIIDRED